MHESSIVLDRPRSSASRVDRGWARRVLRVLGWAAIGIEVLYVVGANSLIAFGGIPKLFSGTDSVQATVRSGWTVVPGHVHLRGLRVTIQDQNIQSSIEIERAFVALRLRELARRVFHATEVRASGVVFRFRNRVEPEGKDRPSVRALPPIAGFEDPPVYEAWVPPPPIPDSRYDLWTVHLEDVVADAKELWVEQFRYLGAARARGGFRLVPARALSVGPASLDVEPGSVVVDGTDTLAHFAGRIDCTVHRFDVRIPQGFEVLRNISARLQLAGSVASARVIGLFLDDAVTVGQAGGQLAIGMMIDHGAIRDGSRLELRGDAARVDHDDLSFRTSEAWSVVGEAHDGLGTATASVRSTALSRDDAVVATLGPASLSMTSTTVDTARPWSRESAEVSVERASAPDLSKLNDPHWDGVHFSRGAATASGWARELASAVLFVGDASVVNAAFSVSGTSVSGSLRVQATSKGFDERRRTGAIEASLVGSALRVGKESGDPECPLATAERLEATAHVETRASAVERASLRAELSRGGIHWGNVLVGGDATVSATLAPSERSAHEHAVSATMRLQKVALRGAAHPEKRWSAHLPTIALAADLRARPDELGGTVDVSAAGASVALRNFSMKSDVAAKLHVHAIEPIASTAVLSGTVNVDRASLWNDAQRVEQWWARLAVDETRIDARRGLDFAGRVRAHLRDGLPVLFALSRADQPPGLAFSFRPSNGLEGTVDVVRRCHLLDIRLPRVEGGALTATGRLQNSAGDTHGAVLVRVSSASPLSAGIAFGGGGSSVSLFSSDSWLAEHIAPLGDALRSEEARTCPPAPPRSSCD